MSNHKLSSILFLFLVNIHVVLAEEGMLIPSLLAAFESDMKAKGMKLIQATELPIRVYENTFIFKKDDSSLRDLFNTEISEMIKNNEVEELIRKYTGSDHTFE